MDMEPEQDLLLSLQDDFNYGMPFDMQQYADKLAFLCGAMGLDRTQALEALLVTENGDPEAAVQYIFHEHNVKIQMRMEAKHKRGQFLMTVDELNDMIQELDMLRREYREVWLSRMNMESFHDDQSREHKLFLYQEFLKGTTSDRYLTEDNLAKIDEFRLEYELTDDDHTESLRRIGISLELYEKMQDSTTAPSRLACVECFEKEKDHIMMDCMHVCLCGDCAEDLRAGPNSECPICKAHVRSVTRVFRS